MRGVLESEKLTSFKFYILWVRKNKYPTHRN